MKHLFELLFWTSGAIVFYTYLGYGILLILLLRIKKPKAHTRNPDFDWPAITHVIAAFNEADIIEAKIKNTLSLEYPSDRLNILIVTDGSSDATPDLVRKYPSIQLYHNAERRGKIHAVNRIMPEIKTPIVVFSDANTLLNIESLKRMVLHFSDPAVGGVAGEKRVHSKNEGKAPGAGEGLYWKYESFLKRLDSQLNSVMGAAGELFSIRTELYECTDENTVIEDFVLSMSIVQKGFRFIYEPDAFAIEGESASTEEEWKRKVRISAGGIQAVVRLRSLLNPFRFGFTTFQYVSHRVLRWTIAPLALLFLFIANLFLVLQHAGTLYLLAFAGQLIFYLFAWLGHTLRNRSISIKGFFVPFYFVIMNLAVYFGFFRYLRGKQSVIWEKSQRA